MQLSNGEYFFWQQIIKALPIVQVLWLIQ